MLSLDFRIGLDDVDNGTFVGSFVESGAGDEALAEQIRQICDGMFGALIDIQPSLERIDSLLSLTG